MTHNEIVIARSTALRQSHLPLRKEILTENFKPFTLRIKY